MFGSRSTILFTTKDICAKVILCAGSNVADNCVILPGGIIGKNAVLASNSLCPEGRYLPEGSVWLGSLGCEPTCLKQGDESSADNGDTIIMASNIQQDALSMIGDASTLRPFGKAFYLRKASYFVWTLEMIIIFTAIVRSIIVTFHTLPLWVAYRYGWLFLAGNNDSTADNSGGMIYITTLLIYLCTHHLRIILWVIIKMIVKWSIIGRRKEGRYNYDTSSYGQRWELYQIIVNNGKFAGMNLMDFINGTSFMTTWLRWNGATIGKDCCLYPAGEILFYMIGYILILYFDLLDTESIPVFYCVRC